MSDYTTPKGAVISGCKKYRYVLWRRWSPSKPLVNFVMLNPSKADAYADDPTIRRCIGFANGWGYGGIIVTNLYGYRATYPGDLHWVDNPIGEKNDEYIQTVAQQSPLIVCAWGQTIREMECKGVGKDKGRVLSGQQREQQVKDLLPTDKMHYLRLTQHGHPYHPLYLKGDLTPVEWKE